MLIYFVAGIVVLMVLSRMGFWSRQPVRHVYNWPKKGYVIPKTWTKFCDARAKLLDDSETDDAVRYVKTKVHGYPDERHVRAYFFNAAVSYIPNEGCVVSRPVTLLDSGTTLKASIYEFWVGSTKQMERRMLCTHEYLRPASPGLFFQDTCISGVLPVVRYPVYWIATKQYKKYHGLRVVRATGATIHLILPFWKKLAFSIRAVPDLPMLLHYVEAKVMSIYYVFETDLVAVFIFKNLFCEEKDATIVDCVGVLAPTPSEAIYQTFSNLMFQIHASYKILRLHGLAHAGSVNRKKAYKTSARFMYAYNYYAPQVTPSKCHVI